LKRGTSKKNDTVFDLREYKNCEVIGNS